MTSVVDGSPANHTPTWSLLLTLSEEPFSYDNFNPAVDSLERLGRSFPPRAHASAR